MTTKVSFIKCRVLSNFQKVCFFTLGGLWLLTGKSGADWQLTTWPFKIWTLFFWWEDSVVVNPLGEELEVAATEVGLGWPTVASEAEAVFKASWIAAILSAIPALLSAGAPDPFSLRTCKVWKILSNSTSMSLSDIKQALEESKVLKPTPEPPLGGRPTVAGIFEAWKK